MNDQLCSGNLIGFELGLIDGLVLLEVIQVEILID